MMYTINDNPISHWGLRAGVINASPHGYALTGVWDLPKRLGETHHNWQGDIEPYVLTDDFRFGGRDLTLHLACIAANATERHDRIAAFLNELPDRFALAHPTLGTFEVGVQRVDGVHYGWSWGGLTLTLREPCPALGAVLPPVDRGAYGIDNRSWVSLGFGIETIDGGHSLGAWQPLAVTTDPTQDTWKSGSRAPKTITIKGTIRGANYAEFRHRVEALQALLSAPDLRRVTYFDGSTYAAFCADGFEVESVCNFQPEHWGRFTCQMIVV